MRFFVPGKPRPQGSKRGFVVKGKAVLVETAGEPLKDWRATVALAAMEAQADAPMPLGPLAVKLRFQMPRPKSHSKTRQTWPTARPDIDKLARAVLDGLTHICYVDDSQITSLYLHKRWAKPDEGEPVGVDVAIWEDNE